MLSPPLGFAVKGDAIPDVSFDVGESYAGSLPISGIPSEQASLFFWFFPTVSKLPEAKKDIIIWLNGGVSWIHAMLEGAYL